MYAWERAPLREIFDFQQIYSVLIRCKKKVQKRMKSRAKIINTALPSNMQIDVNWYVNVIS